MKHEDLLKALTPCLWYGIIDRVKYFWLREQHFPGGVHGVIKDMCHGMDLSPENLDYIESRLYFWDRIQDEVDGLSGDTGYSTDID